MYGMVILKTVLFLCICGTGFCCNTGWLHYQNSCYKIVEFEFDVREAARFCQLSAGQLAYVSNQETLQFFHKIFNYNESVEYWLNESSSLETSSLSNTENTTEILHQSCPYAKLLAIRLEYCTEKKFFICETTYHNPSEFCPAGYDYYGTHCYKARNVTANYVHAAMFCGLQKFKLAILDSESKEWEAKSLVIGTNQTFFVGATKVNASVPYKWSNGNDFDPVLHNVLTDINNTCLGIRSETTEPTVITWVQIDCDEPFSFICEATPYSETTTTEPTTTEVPLVCPHGYNWKSHEASGYCYWETTYETPRLNWFQARDFCKLFGGDLASYRNEAEQSLGLGGAYGHYRGLWFGLQRDKNDVFHWTDGTVLNYTNWNYNEPKLASKSKFCATHASGNSKWELDYCGVRRWFICKAPKVRMTLIPDIPKDKKPLCESEGFSAYRNWYLYKNHCYLIHERAKYSWDTAQLFCQDNGAHLASIHSFEETDFILSASSIFSDVDFWIGLSSRGLYSSYMWSDNSPLEFLYWSDVRENTTDTVDLCVKFNKRDGSWDTDHCNRLLGIICKKGVNSTYDFTTTEPTTVMPGSCENGWYNLGNKCYGLFGREWSKRRTWIGAKEDCFKLGASLVSIHTDDEQDFLADIVLEANTNVWIGLDAKDGGTIFHWDDDSRIDYTHWNENEPDYSSDSIQAYSAVASTTICVDMEFHKVNIGKWNDCLCSEKRAYICQKMKNPLLTEPYQDPFKCPDILGWYKLGTSCYGFFEQVELTWLEAQGECRKYGANLVTFTNSAVQIFLKRKIKKKNSYYWIGAREKMQNKYEFITGQAMFYTNWMAGQPKVASKLFDNCVAATSYGAWIVKSCEEKHSYVCRMSKEPEPEPEIPEENKCINVTGDWIDYGGDNCYLLLPYYRKTWGDAMHYCFKHGGYLASFHSAADIEEVRKHVVSDEPISLHIGLGKRRDGSYAWVDKSPLDFTAWDEDEPDHKDKECVEMSMRNGKWNDITCDETFRGFICSAPKLQTTNEETTTNNSPLQEDIISRKLTIGGIFGIVICILVVLAVIGVTIYYLKPRKELQPKLLESEQL